MQFIDLKAQYELIKDNLNQRMTRVFEHGQFIMGPEVNELEECLSEYTGAKHCISVASGTDALMVAMMALGIKPGDEVITTPFSFFATAEIIMLLGAVPVFVDIDPNTYNINPTLIEQAITDKTKLILPVSLYGQCVEFDEINAVAKKYNLYTVEDAAQSFGATYKGQSSCNMATISCTSFFPSKPLGCYGDGGACFTNDDELANMLRQLRNHGQDRRYHHIHIGLNGRFDTLQAAVLLAKMPIFPAELEKRAEIAAKYNALLENHFAVPTIAQHNTSVYAQYTIQVEDRDEVVKALEAMKIPTAVHYPLSIHQQPIVAQLYPSKAKLPHAENAARSVLSLPFSPYLDDASIYKVSEALLKATSAKVAVSNF